MKFIGHKMVHSCSMTIRYYCFFDSFIPMCSSILSLYSINLCILVYNSLYLEFRKGYMYYFWSIAYTYSFFDCDTPSLADLRRKTDWIITTLLPFFGTCACISARVRPRLTNKGGLGPSILSSSIFHRRTKGSNRYPNSPIETSRP